MTTIWRTSSHSNNGSCVEVADVGDGVLVRNSNHPGAGTLTLTRPQFAAWLRGCKTGEFDDMG